MPTVNDYRVELIEALLREKAKLRTRKKKIHRESGAYKRVYKITYRGKDYALKTGRCRTDIAIYHAHPKERKHMVPMRAWGRVGGRDYVVQDWLHTEEHHDRGAAMRLKNKLKKKGFQDIWPDHNMCSYRGKPRVYDYGMHRSIFSCVREHNKYHYTLES